SRSWRTFGVLNVNNATGVSLTGVEATVNTTLALGANILSTGANTAISASGGTVTRSSGFVIGNLRKTIPTGSNVTQTFEVGTGAVYSPASVTFGSVTTSGTLTGSSTVLDHPSLGSSAIDPSHSANRYWTLTNGGIS